MWQISEFLPKTKNHQSLSREKKKKKKKKRQFHQSQISFFLACLSSSRVDWVSCSWGWGVVVSSCWVVFWQAMFLSSLGSPALVGLSIHLDPSIKQQIPFIVIHACVFCRSETPSTSRVKTEKKTNNAQQPQVVSIHPVSPKELKIPRREKKNKNKSKKRVFC